MGRLPPRVMNLDSEGQTCNNPDLMVSHQRERIHGDAHVDGRFKENSHSNLVPLTVSPC